MSEESPFERRLRALRRALIAAGPSNEDDDANVAERYDWAARQALLPRLPIPLLEDTLRRFLTIVRPLQSPKEHAATEQVAAAFLHGTGRKLHAALVARDRGLGDESYVEAYWNNMYLRGRYPVPLNSNPALLLLPDPPTRPRPQAARAALIARRTAAWYLAMRDGRLKPDSMGGGAPACMAEYARLFATARIPQEGRDRVETASGRDSLVRHIVILRGRDMFTLDILDSRTGRVVAGPPLQAALQQLLDHTADAALIDERTGAPMVSALTGLTRDVWAAARRKIAGLSPKNAETLRVIDSALFVMALDATPSLSWDDVATSVLTGHTGRGGALARPRWFDKTICWVVHADGSCNGGGLNFEHSPFDGSTVVRMLDEVMSPDPNPSLDRLLEPAGDRSSRSGGRPVHVPRLRRLSWDGAATVESLAAKASAEVRDLAAKNQTCLLNFEAFGKEEIKTWRCSPDGAVQAALQLAYARRHRRREGRRRQRTTSSSSSSGVPRGTASGAASFDRARAPCCVYESSSTKRFLHGRTEAIRSASDESALFVRDMLRHIDLLQLLDGKDGPFGSDSSAVAAAAAAASAASVAQRLQASAAAHRARAVEAGQGLGVDRHLFSLLSLAQQQQHVGVDGDKKGEGKTGNKDGPVSPPGGAFFQDSGWNKLNATTLSTSNVTSTALICPGFGAVTNDGYGIGYTLRRDSMAFCVSNWIAETGNAGGFGASTFSVDADASSSGGEETELKLPTDSQAFVRELEASFHDMRALFNRKPSR